MSFMFFDSEQERAESRTLRPLHAGPYEDWMVRGLSLLFVEIFLRNVVLGKFAGSNFLAIGIVSSFDAADRACLERVALVDEFFHAFRVRLLDIRETLRIRVSRKRRY